MLLSTKQVAERYGVTTRTVRKWREQAKGPRYLHLNGSLLRYRVADLEEWEATHRKETWETQHTP